jgi:hypothetical protein
VTVSAAEALHWSKAWALNSSTKAEKDVMKDMLFGSGAPITRQKGGELLLAAARRRATQNVEVLRADMAGDPSRFKPPGHLLDTRDAWRTVQVRQLFRLALEAFLHWTLIAVQDRPMDTEALLTLFLASVSGRKHATTRQWLAALKPQNIGPAELMDEISAALSSSPNELPDAILRGLALCLAEAPEKENLFERPDRLPLARARRETQARDAVPGRDFLCHVLESWVLAQHVYWSVGRGLADARAQGKTLLRLKVVLDEGGWAPAPGVSGGSVPVPTADRLHTMVSLAAECGLL